MKQVFNLFLTTAIAGLGDFLPMEIFPPVISPRRFPPDLENLLQWISFLQASDPSVDSRVK